MKCPKCGSKRIIDLTKQNERLKCRNCGYQDFVINFEKKIKSEGKNER